jgi:hypothetical protein
VWLHAPRSPLGESEALRAREGHEGVVLVRIQVHLNAVVQRERLGHEFAQAGESGASRRRRERDEGRGVPFPMLAMGAVTEQR